jgi:MFS family permease
MTDSTDRHKRRYVTAALMLVMVLASMEMTITATAMPTIIGDLHGLEYYSWVASIYLLASTVTMPLYGRLSDALGRKRVLLFAIVLFCLASLLAASARSMTQLIVYRGLQGLGAGGVMPVTLTILGDIFTLKERARIQGAFSAVWGTAALAGPALGAFFVKTLGWRSIFFVNLPFGVMALFVLAWKYHDREKPRSTDLDLPGVATLTIGCLSVLALVSRLGPGGWSWQVAAGLVALAVSSIAYYIQHERRSENPILPVELVRHRAIGPSILGTFLFGFAFLSLETYVPLYVQGGRGGGAGAAASVITPVMLTWALSGPIFAPLLVRWGFRNTAVLGAVLIVVGFTGLLVCATFAAPQWMLTAILALTGFGFGPASMSYLLSAQDAVQWHQRGGVTGTIGFFRSIGAAVGVGVLGGLFNVLMLPELRQLRAAGVAPSALLEPHELSRIPADTLARAQDAIAGALTWVFVAMLLVAVVQVAVTTLMPRRKIERAVPAAEAMEVMAS